ncbi:hypothetical protein HAX54_038260 [Datura stramonium]|uniref:Uncharacterized protein n=1 Tax=Datura stramonium TaxID=4076 RepID=A0ABS8VMI8_DATST|nr:hypothetical protein [Datura stramonium]
MSGIRVDLDEEGTNDVDGYEKEHFTNLNDEASDESDDLQNVDSAIGIYNYTVNMFLKKDVDQVFLKMTTNEARKSRLEYNYELHLMEM